MNSAEEYAKLIERLNRDNGMKREAGIWKGFLALARPGGDVDWETSRQLAAWYQSESRMCFQNALRIAQECPEYQYCEGLATSIIPTEHAWLVDVHGRVLDPTWVLLLGGLDRERPTDYFGIVLPVPEVEAAFATREVGGPPAWFDTVRRQLAPAARVRGKKRH